MGKKILWAILIIVCFVLSMGSAIALVWNEPYWTGTSSDTLTINYQETATANSNSFYSYSDVVNYKVSLLNNDGTIKKEIVNKDVNVKSMVGFETHYITSYHYEKPGNYKLQFTLSDKQYPYTVRTKKLTLKVNDIASTNNPPKLNALTDQSVYENSPVSFTVSGSDPDGHSTAISLSPSSSLPSGATFDTITGSFSWTPNYTQGSSAGTKYSVTFRITDAYGLYEDATVVITVFDKNRCPTLSSIGNKQVVEESAFSFYVSGSDDDSNTLSYSVTTSPTITASFDSSTGYFYWPTKKGDAGNYTAWFSVTDGSCSTQETVNLEVLPQAKINIAPVLQAIGNKSVVETYTLSFTLNATDANSDTLTYGLTSNTLPSTAVLDESTGVFTWETKVGDKGTYDALFTVSDGTDIVFESITITVTKEKINTCPVLLNPGNKSVTEESQLSFYLNATDANNDSLTYSFSSGNLPSGPLLGYSNGHFIWNTKKGDAGTYPIMFTVSDGTCQVSEEIVVTVGVGNSCPVLSYLPSSVQLSEGENYSLDVNATDADNDQVTFSVSNNPTGSTFVNSTGVFSWTPSSSQSGTYKVYFEVTDGTCKDGSEVVFYVNDKNTCPSWSQISSQSVQAGKNLTFNVSATDSESDPLTYYSSTLPDDSTFDTKTNTFNWKTDDKDVGEYNASFLVSDGSCVKKLTVKITVTKGPNKCPVADFTYLPKNPDLLQSVNLMGSGSDADGDALSYAWDTNDDGKSDAFTQNTAISFNTKGEHNVTLRVNDGKCGNAVTKTITVVPTCTLDVTKIDCFPNVISDEMQSCTIKLSAGSATTGGVKATLYNFATDKELGSCVSSSFTGACAVTFNASKPGNYSVYATANRTACVADTDKTPTAKYKVLKRQHSIANLAIYNDRQYTTEDYDFNRGQVMFVKFRVLDTMKDPVENAVTSVALVSPDHGGRAYFDKDKYPPAEAGYYHYLLQIPPKHDFLGNSQVFSFYFNFTDGSGAQKVMKVYIRNNKPVIAFEKELEVGKTFSLGGYNVSSVATDEKELTAKFNVGGGSTFVLSEGMSKKLTGGMNIYLHDIDFKTTPNKVTFALEADNELWNKVFNGVFNKTTTIDLSKFESDVEDSGAGLDWYIVNASLPNAVVALDSNRDKLTISPKSSGSSVLALELWDLDNAKDTINVVINTLTTKKMQCADGIDNDGDGLIDFPNDKGCANASDDDERDEIPKVQCADGKDNDNDGLIDLKDPGCSSSTDNNESDDPTVDLKPSVTLNADKTSGIAPLTVKFNCSVTGGDKPYSSTTFFSGEGVTATTSLVVDYTYTTPGTYVALCSVSDKDGDNATDTKTITVTNQTTTKPQCADGLDNDSDGLIDLNDPGCTGATDDNETDPVSTKKAPVALLTVNPTNGKSPLLITADGSKSYDLDGNITDHSWVIEYPDKSTVIYNKKGVPTTITETLTQEGNHTIWLTVIDNDYYYDYNYTTVTVTKDNYTNITKKQCADGIDNDSDGLIDLNDPGCADATDDDETDVVLNKAPVPVLTLSKSQGIAPLTIIANGSASYDSDGNIVDHTWTVYDAKTSNVVFTKNATGKPGTLSYTFTTKGDYTIKLIVIDDDKASAYKEDSVKVYALGDLPQCNDGIDNDGDGFVDLNDPHCYDSNDTLEGELLYNKPVKQFVDRDVLVINQITLNGISADAFAVNAGDIVKASIAIENNLASDLDDIKVHMAIDELGIWASDKFDIDSGDTKTSNVVLDIPYYVTPGLYDLRVTVSNDDVRRVKFRTVEII